MHEQDDRVALVTGAASGIGAAVSEELAATFRVAVADLDTTGSQREVDSIEALGGKALAVHLDVTSRESWEKAISRIEAELGRVAILVNSAGILREALITDITDEDWDAVMDVHLRAPMLGAQSVIPRMREIGWGRIINVSSTSTNGELEQAHYAAAKAGVIGLTKTIALECAGDGILVNAVRPGSVDTPLTQGMSQEIRAAGIAKTPMQREGKPGEIASVVAFLASARASYVTGEVITIDGGFTLG